MTSLLYCRHELFILSLARCHKAVIRVIFLSGYTGVKDFKEQIYWFIVLRTKKLRISIHLFIMCMEIINRLLFNLSGLFARFQVDDCIYIPSTVSPPPPPNTAPPNTAAHFQVPNKVLKVIYDSLYRRFPNTAAFSSVPRSAVLGGTTVYIQLTIIAQCPLALLTLKSIFHLRFLKLNRWVNKTKQIAT